MAIQYLRRGSALTANQYSRPGKSAIFVDSDDDQLKFTTGSSGTTTVDVVTESQTQTLTNKTHTSPTITGPAITGATTFVHDAGTITGEIHGVDITSTGTHNSSDDNLVGLNVAVTPIGTLGTWASGIFAKVTQTVNAIDGYISAAEFEVNKSGTYTNRNYAVVVLNNGNNMSGAQSSSAYILCREYGSNVLNALVKFGDNASYSATASAAVPVSVTVAKTHNLSVRCIVTIAGVATPVWLMATTTAPSA